MNQLLEEHPWYHDLAGEGRLVVSRALHEIDYSYGSTAETAISPYNYHNGVHTRLACEDFSILRDTLGFTEAEFVLGITAMSAHDIVKTFDRPAGVDEDESANWWETQLRALPGVSQIAIKTGRLAIIGTTPRFDNGTIVQKAMEQTYPTKRAELIAHAVAGADVGRLFTPQGPWLSHQLYKEMQAASGNLSELMEGLIAFQNSQIEFLLNYSYPDRDIENALATHKVPVIKYLGNLSHMLEQGVIENWEQLLDLDSQFIESNA